MDPNAPSDHDASNHLRVPEENTSRPSSPGSPGPSQFPAYVDRSLSPNNGGRFSRSRAGSVASATPAGTAFSVRTPDPVDELSADSYFDTLQQLRSQNRSRASTRESTHAPMSISRRPITANYPNDRPHLASQAGRQPSIRIRRSSNASMRRVNSRDSNLSSKAGPAPTQTPTAFAGTDGYRNPSQSGRPRSISQPEQAHLSSTGAGAASMHSRRTPQIAMPRLTEEGARPSLDELGVHGPLEPSQSLPEEVLSEPDQDMAGQGPWHRRMMAPVKAGRSLWPSSSRRRSSVRAEGPPTGLSQDPARDLYDAEMVDYLDTIDPEVQTLSTLTNVQNSLFIPDLGGWLNRRPTYTLSQIDPESGPDVEATARPPTAPSIAGTATLDQVPEDQEKEEEAETYDPSQPGGLQRSNTITSRLTDSHYAALPHGKTLEGWTAEDKTELDDHVRHMLHSRRSKFRRRMRGFGQYVRRPLGFFVTLYATLITLFGLAWVLFLIGWIYVGSRQSYTIHIIDSVLVALFAIMGDGLAPFRAVDSYHLFFVVRYMRKIRRFEQGKPPRSRLEKKNVPPEVRASFDELAAQQAIAMEEREQQRQGSSGNPGDEPAWPAEGTGEGLTNPTSASAMDGEPIFRDMEEAHKYASHEYPLTAKQAASLEHHRGKLAKSHSFYKPDETNTHYAFPLQYLIAVVVLLDCHSCLQISLGACTWGIDYHTRPFALTTVILCVSITCNITAGLVITIGDRKTRKKEVHKLMNRQELTGDAIRHMEKKRKKEQEEEEKQRQIEQKKEEHRLLAEQNYQWAQQGQEKAGHQDDSGSSGQQPSQSGHYVH